MPPDSSFSVKGSPTCTVGLLLSESLLKEEEAIDAPCIPSLPVLAPTYTNRTIWGACFCIKYIIFVYMIPTVIALTKGFPE